MNESWHTYERVMAHIWTSHGTHMNESWHTSLLSSLWLTCLISMCAYHSRDDEKENKKCVCTRDTHTFEPKSTFQNICTWKARVDELSEYMCSYSFMAHIWMSHDTHMSESCVLWHPPLHMCASWHTYEWVVCTWQSLVWISMCESWPWYKWMCVSHGFPTRGWVMALVLISMCESWPSYEVCGSWHTYEWVCVSHGLCLNECVWVMVLVWMGVCESWPWY